MQTVLFVHGLGQQPGDWQGQVTALPTGWRALTPWLLGLEPGGRAAFDLDTAVRALVRHLDTAGAERAHVVGLSLGAVLALRLAATHPERVDRLVVSGGQVRPPRVLMALQATVMGFLPASRFEPGTKAQFLGVLRGLRALDLRPDLPRIEARTLVMIGDRDKANRSAAKAIAEGIVGARLVEVEGGHLLNTDAPEDFNGCVYGFLA